MIAQQQQGATVLLEHRFFGYSNPYNNLTSQSLEVLTIQQAIDDFVYFAQNVNLPMPGGDNVKPSTTPWILLGASYSGGVPCILAGEEMLTWSAHRCTDKLDDGEVSLFQKGREMKLIDFALNSKPGIFHAGYASSAVVEVITYVYLYPAFFYV